MAIQNRRGNYTDFNGGANLQDGEFGIVMSGDPNTDDGSGTYINNGGGIVHRLVTEDDLAKVDETLRDLIWYKSGDTVSGAFSVDGYITSSSNQLILDLHLPKLVLDNASFTLSAANFQYARLGYGGYLPNIPTLSDVSAVSARHGKIRIVVNNFATGATNNCVVGGEITITGTFN